jgi:hypothetical protein
MRVTSALSSAAFTIHLAMSKPRLFSTLRCLQHENPLVCVVEYVEGAMADGAGSSALWCSSADAAHAARTAAEEEHQRCEESDCRIICKGGCREEYNCWYAS